MDFFHSSLLTAKMGSWFSFSGATRLKVSKTYTGLLGSRCKRYDILPLLSQIILWFTCNNGK